MSEDTKALSQEDYVRMFQEGATYQYDETQGRMMVHVDGQWIPCASIFDVGGASSVSPLSGVTTSATGTLSAGGSLGIDSTMHLRALAVLNALVNAVKAGASCRCAPTEICPECHDLNRALDEAQLSLEEMAYRPAPSPPATQLNYIPSVGTATTGTTVTLGGTVSVSGSVGIPAGSLTFTGTR